MPEIIKVLAYETEFEMWRDTGGKLIDAKFIHRSLCEVKDNCSKQMDTEIKVNFY